MTFKALTIGAMAALMATGALAQGTQPTTPPTTPATPPAATTPAPDTGAATSTTQTTTTKTESVSFKSSLGANEMLSSRLVGMAVRNSAGENLGDVNDVVMDNTGKANVVIIGVGGFLGLGEKNVGVPFASLTFADANDGQRVARLDVNKDALQAAPAFVYQDKGSGTSTGTPPAQRTQ